MDIPIGYAINMKVTHWGLSAILMKMNQYLNTTYYNNTTYRNSR